MAAVSDALAHDDVCLVEAGTGVGKTLAYLAPALQSGIQTVVATGTRALMDQIHESDVPLLQGALPFPFSVAVLKGRANYLCQLRFAAEWDSLDLFGDDDRGLARDVRNWMRITQTGDLAELKDVREGHPFLRRIVSTSDTCPGRACPRFGQCFLLARARAQEADLVITNHHLFFADLVMSEDGSGAILPDDSVLILDEAHGLVDVATAHFGFTVRSGTMADLGHDSEELALRGDPAHSRVLLKVARRLEKRFLGLVAHLVDANGRVAVTPGMLGPKARKAWHDIDVDLEILGEEASRTATEMDMESDIRPRSGRVRETLGAVLADDDPAFVRLAERRGRRGALSALPVDVSGMLRERVFLSGRPVVLVSATITVNGSTDFARTQMGVPEGASELVLASPYDFEDQVLLYLPRAIPEPNDKGFYEALSKEALSIVRATGGRAFLLFTSHAGLRKAYELMKDELAFPLLVQGEAPRDELLRRFKATPGSCLFGTHTFWQGVDVMGDALSCVIIDRLPFDPPDDPVLEARRDRVAQKGGKPFYDYQLPLAVIKLRQGFGRLVRRRSDRGVVAIMDVRIRTKKYGRTFLSSLPSARQCSDPDELAAWCREKLDKAGRS
ncbi:MAG: ATP-dependent DNA helicase [Deltaproteobacteria bacterium]|nr:ATP-dependent DNA helicase [Deltaproteobacteria bacterium]